MIQYIYARYGRHRAGLAATVISLSRALGRARRRQGVGAFGGYGHGALAGMVWGTTAGGELPEKHVRASGPRSSGSAARGRHGTVARADGLSAPPVAACRRLRADARAARSRSCRSATRRWTDRTFIEWDKDDIAALGTAEGRRAGARHADLHPQGASISSSSIMAGR